MPNNCVQLFSEKFDIDTGEPILKSIFVQYEYVIVESLITTFGLDFLVDDKHGGDVDTIYNVRQIGLDEQMEYKNRTNKSYYDNQESYSSKTYHSDNAYIQRNREISKEKKSGILKDEYTGEIIHVNGKTDLDHTISAKEIHEDRGRVLSHLKGTDLANSDDNLHATNPHTNRTKKADSMEEFQRKHGSEYTELQNNNMAEIDEKSRKNYNKKIAKAYYTSPAFVKDVSKAAGKISLNVAIKQGIGFVFTEIWFSVKAELDKLTFGLNLDLGEFFTALGRGIKTGFENAKKKYNVLFSKVFDGALSGALSSLTTSLCNIFFTTGKNIVKIIRQTYASLVEALKILLINPDNLLLGDRINAFVKILSTGASVVLGVIVSEAIEKTPLGCIPVIGDVVQTFCGTFVTGIMSCTFLYILDSNEIIIKLVTSLNKLHCMEYEISLYHEQALLFEKYAAELMKINVEKFQEETEIYNSICNNIESVSSQEDLNVFLTRAIKKIGIKIPWGNYDSFDSFMNDKNAILRFE